MDIASKIPNDSQQLVMTSAIHSRRKNNELGSAEHSGQPAKQRQQSAQSPFRVTDPVRLSAEGLQAAARQQGSATAAQAVAAERLPVYSAADGGFAMGSGAVSPDEEPMSPAAADVAADRTTSVSRSRSESSDEAAAAESPSENPSTSTPTAQLSDEAKQEIQELSLRDQEVQVHEAAHAAVGGQYAGAPSLTYETGPDGKRYAVAGEVNIDMSEVPGDPQATIDKAEVIRAAALAPAQPSGQDRNVAAKASQMKAKAQAELMAESAAAGSQMVQNDVAAQRGLDAGRASLDADRSPTFRGAVA